MRTAAALILGAFVGQGLTPEVAQAIVAQFPADPKPVDVAALPVWHRGSVNFTAERVHTNLAGLDVLHQAQWLETEGYQQGIALNMDMDAIVRDDLCGALVQLMARDRESGALVGQCRMYLARSRHTQRRIGVEDTFFLLPEYRRGRAAWRLGEYVETCLCALGVQDAYLDDKVANPAAGRLLEAQGYRHIANRRFKKLRD